MSLRKRNILTTFGFFDLDAIFSAAFIMILTLIVDSTCEEGQRLAPRPGLSEALEILDFLAGRGNDFALQRAREVRRMRDHLSTFLDIPKNSPSEFRTNRPGTSGVTEGQPAATTVAASTPGYDGEEARVRQRGFPESTTGGSAERGGPTPPGRTSKLGSRSLLDSSLWNDISYLWMQQPGVEGEGSQAFEVTEGMADVLPEDAYDWNSIFHSQDLTLTGQDLGDFGELERHLLGFGG